MKNSTWLVLIDGYAIARVDAPTEECVRRWAVARYGCGIGMEIVEDLDVNS